MRLICGVFNWKGRKMARSGLIGDRRLERKLKQMAGSVQNRIGRRPTSAALTPINKAAKRNAPKKRGFLRRSIGKKVKTFRGGVWGGVGPRIGPAFEFIDETGKKRIPANYGPKVEFGTKDIAPNAFLRRAFSAQKGTALSILTSGIRKNIETEAKKK